MSETSDCGPRVAIFDNRGVLLHESAGTAFGDRSLKHIINTLRTVQRETNEFLTKLVNKQTSQNAGKNESATEDKDSVDEEDDGGEDEDESACPKKRRQQ